MVGQAVLTTKKTHFKQPQGAATRGKTAPNRLRRLDNFLTMYDPELLKRSDGPFSHGAFVDVGFGFYPVTTEESASRFRKLNPRLPVIGVEIDRQRVREAQKYVRERTDYRVGGFNFPLKNSHADDEKETVRLVRAFNVLRQYDNEADVPRSHQMMCTSLLPGGLLVEGTSDPPGRTWVTNVVRKTGDGALRVEALVFSTNFRNGFDIVQFQEVLPKNFIHRLVPGEMINDFFDAWKRSFELVCVPLRNQFPSLRFLFSAVAEHLAENTEYRIITQRQYTRKGFLVWLLTDEDQQHCYHY
eukprot:Colp12_sorted_trinity150504_noHs@32870